MAKKQSSLLDQLGQELTCPICLERLKEPKVFPCLHTFCKDCLLQSTRRHNKTDAECPKCRENHALPAGGVDKLLTNFTANSLLELLEVHEAEHSQGKGSSLRCENGLDENEAAARCLDCSIYLCAHCWDVHQKQKATRQHNMVSLSQIKDAGEKCLQKPRPCEKHEDQQLKLYCRTCSSAICRDCTIVDHRNHEYVFIKDVQEELQGRLKESASALETREKELQGQVEVLQELDARQKKTVEDCKMDIARRAAEMRKKIDREEAEAMKVAESVQASKKKFIDAKFDTLSFSLAKVSSKLVFVQRLLKSGSDVEIASSTAQVIERSKEVVISQDEGPEINLANIKCNQEFVCTLEVSEKGRVHVDGLTRLSRGPNTINIESPIEPMIEKLILIVNKRSVNVSYTISKVAVDQWKVQFILRETGTCEFIMTANGQKTQKQIKIVEKMAVGKRVKRGPDWKWGEQDKQGLGTVTRNLPSTTTGWVRVEWDGGISNSYRWGDEKAFDVEMV